MDQGACVGCRTSFFEAESLPLDSAATEYRDFDIPIKNDSSRWILLKDIVSFLNSRGGTIYIGVEQNKGSVKGIFMDWKQRDNFKLQTKQLIEKIYPKVDLNNKQEVEIQYAPVFKGNNFQGKFVIKIIVQQGDPTQVYCMNEKIKIQEDGKDTKPEQFQVFYAFDRKATGGISELKGEILVNRIYDKARTGKKQSIFHDDCNPPLPYIDLQIRTIWITNINEFQYDFLKQGYEDSFQKMQIDYTINYFKDGKRAEIYIEDEEDFENVKEYISQNIEFLNNLFRDSDLPVGFVVKGEVQHYFLIQNRGEKSKAKNQTKGEKKEVKKDQKFPYQEKKKEEKIEKVVLKPKREITAQIPRKMEQKVQNLPIQVDNVIVFTHIAPQSIVSLQRYLTNSIYRAYHKKFIHYANSIQLHLETEKQMQNYLSQLLHKESQLAGYGFKQEIRYGICENRLKICNADWNKGKEMKTLLKEMMGPELLDLKNDKNSLICSMVSREATCEWLDLLLQDRQFKKMFAIKGKNDHVPKMKIYLSVSHTAKG